MLFHFFQSGEKHTNMCHHWASQKCPNSPNLHESCSLPTNIPILLVNISTWWFSKHFTIACLPGFAVAFPFNNEWFFFKKSHASTRTVEQWVEWAHHEGYDDIVDNCNGEQKPGQNGLRGCLNLGKRFRATSGGRPWGFYVPFIRHGWCLRCWPICLAASIHFL